jgi:hypothetical protein
MLRPELAERSSGLAEPTAIQRWALISWPAFLAACLLEALVFSMVDPNEIHWLGHQLQASRQAVYTAAFFCFWLIAMASNALVLWLGRPAQAINGTTAD